MKTDNCTFPAGLQHQKKKKKKNCACDVVLGSLPHVLFCKWFKQYGINKIINAVSFIKSQNFIPLCLLSSSSGKKNKNL